MKKIIYSTIIMIAVILALSISAYANTDNSYLNGTDMYSDGVVDFYSNIDDENKLYKLNFSDRTEEKVLNEHIISMVNKDQYLYLLTCEDEKSNLLKFNMQDNSVSIEKSFSSFVTNIALRDSILYYVEEQNIFTYNLRTKENSIFIENENIDFIYFTEWNTLKYLVKNGSNYDTKIYDFNAKATEQNEVSFFSLQSGSEISLMSVSSYSPRLSAPSTTNSYYIHTSYGGLNECIHISGGSVLPNCVGYAWGRSYENLGYRPNLSKGDAGTWYDYNINNGYYPYGKTPYLGAVAVWKKTGGAGHVAVVEVIDGDVVITSESGYNSSRWWKTTRSTSNSNFSASASYIFQGFIYVCGQPVLDSEAPTISGLCTSNVSGNSFTINCNLNDNAGVTRVWLNVYGPGGSNGFDVSASNGNFSYTINTADYGGAGIYSVHLYAFDGAGNSSSAALSDINAINDTENPVLCNLYTSNISSNSFTVNCEVYDNTAVTRAYIIVYGPGGNSGNGFSIDVFNNFSYTINTADYGGTGTYSVHVYIFDAAGNSACSAVNNFIVEPLAVNSFYVSDVGINSFTLNCEVNSTINRAYIIVYGPGGNSGNGFDIYDINSSSFTKTINVSDYGGAGEYVVHLYVFDSYGNAASNATNSFTIDPLTVNEFYVSDISTDTFTLSCNVNSTISRAYIIVYGPGGNSGNGFDIYDINSSSFTKIINILDYGGKGEYVVHVYVFDSSGNSACSATSRFCIPSQYNVAFDATGGITPITNKNITYNAPYGTLPIPSRTGYTFKGWYTDKTGGSEITSETIVNTTSDITLYAQWKSIIPYTESIVTKLGTKLIIDTKVHNITEPYDILIAGYKNNKFVTTKRVLHDEQNSPYTLEGDMDKIKVMVWDGLSTLKPLCDAEEIHSSKWIAE